MPSDFPIKDPQEIWQNQPTEPLKMSATDLRRKALQRQSKARFEALSTIIIGIIPLRRLRVVLCQGPRDACAHGLGPAESLRDCVPHITHTSGSGRGTCRRRLRSTLASSSIGAHSRGGATTTTAGGARGCPFFLLLGMVMAGVGTGARNAPPHPLLNAVPFFVLLAIWAVAFLLMRKKLGRENLQQEIEELRAFERENR